MSELEQKILTGLSKIGVALRELAWKRAVAFDLNPTQTQILTLLLEQGITLSASDISTRLGVTRASASDSISAVEAKGLIRKQSSPTDGRSVAIQLTAKGQRVARELAVWPEDVTQIFFGMSEHERGVFLNLLSKTIAGLQQQRSIPISRMCVTCIHFRPHQYEDDDKPHHCALIDAAFGNESLRLNCPEHEPARGEKR